MQSEQYPNYEFSEMYEGNGLPFHKAFEIGKHASEDKFVDAIGKLDRRTLTRDCFLLAVTYGMYLAAFFVFITVIAATTSVTSGATFSNGFFDNSSETGDPFPWVESWKVDGEQTPDGKIVCSKELEQNSNATMCDGFGEPEYSPAPASSPFMAWFHGKGVLANVEGKLWQRAFFASDRATLQFKYQIWTVGANLATLQVFTSNEPNLLTFTSSDIAHEWKTYSREISLTKCQNNTIWLVHTSPLNPAGNITHFFVDNIAVTPLGEDLN